MSIYISMIYDDISNIYGDISQNSSKGWDEGDYSCTIVAYTSKKGA
jgi:hypothetical protein